MTRERVHRSATLALRTCCGVHIAALLLTMNVDLAHAPGWVGNTLALGAPLVIFVVYLTSLASAPEPQAGKRSWGNGKLFLGWLLLAVVLLAANLLSNLKFGF